MRFRWQGRARLTPPASLLRGVGVLRRLADAPVDRSFRDWAGDHVPEATIAALCSAAGVLTFDHDPGRLSAASVAAAYRTVVVQRRLPARYVVGGWSTLVDALATGARRRGVEIETGARVDALPEDGPVVVATSLDAAARLLGEPGLHWPGTRTVLLDVGLRAGRHDPSIVADLDDAGWADRFSATDDSLAPDGHELVQLHMGARPGELLEDGVGRLERLLDDTFPNWRPREVWRRRSLIDGLAGPIHLPGTTWRDRPAVDRGNGVYLCGDRVAVPGHLAEVAWASAIVAARDAVAAARSATGSIATSR